MTNTRNCNNNNVEDNNGENNYTLDMLQAEWRCFAYGEMGHLANRCPNSRPRVNPPAAATPSPTHGDNIILIAAKQNYVHGKANHVAMEEA
jgi:hypothetical protein